MSKYGVDNPMKIYSVKQKLKNSLLDKYGVDGVRKHRFNYNKSRLLSKFEVDSDKSESEIMNSIGYNKIWGCGLKKWVYEN